jgi:hypothetical protein
MTKKCNVGGIQNCCMLKLSVHKVRLSISSNMSICVYTAAYVHNTCSEHCYVENNLRFHLSLKRIILMSNRLWFIFSVCYPPAGLRGPTFIATHAELCCERNVSSRKQGYKQHISRISLLDRL